MLLKIFLLFMIGFQFAMSETYDKVNLTYVYQTRCPFCLEFVGDQFHSGYSLMADYIDLELVPIVRINDGVITCAHGTNECFISRAQACAFTRPGVTQKLQAEYLYCTEKKAIDGDDVVDSDIEACVNSVLADVVSYDTVKTCMNNDESDSLLKVYYDKADEYGVEFVPWLGLFGKFDDTTEQHLRSNFVKVICELLTNPPDICSK